MLLFVNGVYPKDITFNHLTTEEGLSQFSVNSIYEDELYDLIAGGKFILKCNMP
jgi:hypothetical protein